MQPNESASAALEGGRKTSPQLDPPLAENSIAPWFDEIPPDVIQSEVVGQKRVRTLVKRLGSRFADHDAPPSSEVMKAGLEVAVIPIA